MPFVLLFLAVIIVIVVVNVRSSSKRTKAGNAKNDEILTKYQADGYVFDRVHKNSEYLIAVDDAKRKLVISKFATSVPLVLDYGELIDFDVSEDGTQVMSSKSGGATLGGLLFGATGAIIGSSGKREVSQKCTKLTLKIFIDNIKIPQVAFEFIDSPTDKSGFVYKQTVKRVDDIVASLVYIMNKKKSEQKLL